MKTIFLILLFTIIPMNLAAQLKLGAAKTEINFREGPGLQHRIAYTINHSNLLVILPRESKNDFIEVFDVESSSYGFVAKDLIEITDTLNFQPQQVFEKTGETKSGEVEMELVNQTSKSLYVWINGNSYSLSPFEKKVLIMNSEEIIYFSSAPGLFPVFGKENLTKGKSYRWSFSL